MSDLTKVETHFDFGKNWRDFVSSVDAKRIDAAAVSLERLISRDELRGKSFLDIGCGSGLSLLAAQQLGAGSLYGCDIDPVSIEAAEQLFEKFGVREKYALRNQSVFDLDPSQGQYDVVHSWGVLHHTGSMWRALTHAAAMVKPGGLFVVALYKKTKFCKLWQWEKRLYSSAPPPVRKLVKGGYMAAWIGSKAIRGQRPLAQIRQYEEARGMSWSHDIHDWLGGFPYESATPPEVSAALAGAGFEIVRTHVQPEGWGVLGTGCDEFVARRR